jgi:murein DD-endopeptidase MepM/ murein hydrolase activator NlpD
VYAHLSQQDVEIGERIQAGEILGRAGNTGMVTGPHLHFELRKDGVPINPLTYIPFLVETAQG